MKLKKSPPRLPSYFSHYTNSFNQAEGKDRSKSRKRKKK